MTIGGLRQKQRVLRKTIDRAEESDFLCSITLRILFLFIYF